MNDETSRLRQLGLTGVKNLPPQQCAEVYRELALNRLGVPYAQNRTITPGCTLRLQRGTGSVGGGRCQRGRIESDRFRIDGPADLGRDPVCPGASQSGWDRPLA